MYETEQELDITELKYVLYARKSTVDESRQQRSIPDQITDCEKLQQRLGLNVVKILKEDESAKKPNKRPIFNQMLKDLKAGVYDGILAWNPDRLARNMLEGGVIINMVDEGEIKDLKFVTHYFTKDANGKMLLGMAFVLSKQYSDDLSQKVTRGVRNSLFEGKAGGTPKYGYYRDKQGYYRPDGKNFELIKAAWRMRGNGESYSAITKYLNDNGFYRLIKSKGGRKVRMVVQKLTDIFCDPFYYGLLVQAQQSIDLRTIPGYDFVPAVSEEDYNAVQALSFRRIKPYKLHRLVFYPLRQMVKCALCGGNMVVGPSTGEKGKRYLFYRCDNHSGTCTRSVVNGRRKSGLRAKVIFDFVYKFLENGLNFTEKEYKEYYEGMKQLTDTQREKIRIQIHSNEARIKILTHEIKSRSLKILDVDKNSTIWKVNEKEIKDLEIEKEDLESDNEELQSKLIDPEKDYLSYEQFLNLSKNAAAKVKAADAVGKDRLCRLIFLNFSVDETKVASFELKEPFATLIKRRQEDAGRGSPA